MNGSASGLRIYTENLVGGPTTHAAFSQRFMNTTAVLPAAVLISLTMPYAVWPLVSCIPSPNAQRSCYKQTMNTVLNTPATEGLQGYIERLGSAAQLLVKGLQPLPLIGTARLNGRDLSAQPTRQHGVRVVFQDPLLFAHMTVDENLLLAVPSQLPAGQRARVALMRALLAEPFSKLDAALRAQLRPWVFAHVRERRIPVVLVTHDEQDVTYPQRVMHLRATEESPAHV